MQGLKERGRFSFFTPNSYNFTGVSAQDFAEAIMLPHIKKKKKKSKQTHGYKDCL